MAPTQTTKPNAFSAWLAEVSPELTWDWQYLRHIQAQLERVTRGEIRRLMLFVPPRHGKSEMVTVRYPVWRMKQDPGLRVVVGAYSQTLANRFSRKSRRIAKEQFELDTERRAVEEWETAAGGTYRAVGVGAGITGQGGHLIIIDDPVKNREEANSETYREKVWQWYTDDLYTRLEPDATIILIMTRWHEDDLAGRILASDDADQWTVISLPAEAEEDDPLGRLVGAALCPERYDLPALASIKRVLGHSYYALYQQRPTPPEGGMFKRHWFQIVDAAPRDAQRVRAWDRAATENAGDYTVGLLMAKDKQGVFYVEDVVRGQFDDLQCDKIIKQVTEMDAANYGNVTSWLEQEPGSSGKQVAKITIRALAGHVVKAERSTGDKSTRAQPYAAQCGAENVKLVKGAWNFVYLNELASFPFGTHDDQVDTSSLAFNKLTLTPPRRQGGSYQG
jgi:predicted phage terminase large subunit-like protein